MRKLLILALILIGLAACNRGEEVDLDGIPGEDTPGTAVEDSPRNAPPPTPTTLPATWTPPPSNPEGHISGAPDSSGATPDVSVTRFIYIVQRGDTLAEISQRFGVPLAELARVNNITDWDRIEVGQELIIPES